MASIVAPEELTPPDGKRRVTIVQVDNRNWTELAAANSSHLVQNNAYWSEQKGWEYILYNVSKVCPGVFTKKFHLHGTICREDLKMSAVWLKVDALLELLSGRPVDPEHIYLYMDTDAVIRKETVLHEDVLAKGDIFVTQEFSMHFARLCEKFYHYSYCLNTGILVLRHSEAAMQFLRDWSRTRRNTEPTAFEIGEQRNTLFDWCGEQDRLSALMSSVDALSHPWMARVMSMKQVRGKSRELQAFVPYIAGDAPITPIWHFCISRQARSRVPPPPERPSRLNTVQLKTLQYDRTYNSPGESPESTRVCLQNQTEGSHGRCRKWWYQVVRD